MPSTQVDKSRIQGFGSSGKGNKKWTCTKGHLLQPWTAKPGTCDGCHRKVNRGDKVMDCRQCNYYLCQECHPQEQFGYGDSMWDTLYSVVDAATLEVTELAKDLSEGFDAAVSVVTCSAPTKDKLGECEVDFSSKKDDDPKPKAKGVGKAKGNSSSSGKKAAAAKAAAAEADAESSATQKNEPSASSTSRDNDSSKTEPVKKEAPPPTDLMDFGQGDLLDLSDPQPAATQAATQVEASSQQPDLTDLFEPTALAGFGAIPAPPAPNTANAADKDLLLFD